MPFPALGTSWRPSLDPSRLYGWSPLPADSHRPAEVVPHRRPAASTTHFGTTLIRQGTDMGLSYRMARCAHDDRKETAAPWGRRRHWFPPRSPDTPAAPEARAPVYRVAGLVVDCATRRAEVEGHQLGLTWMEFELIAHLAAHPDRVYTRRQLMELVWQQAPTGDLRSVDVHISRLRRKLGPEHRALIRTVRQAGYALNPRLTLETRFRNTT
ncbi:winged helix-turn-helix domain-containing protein [Streptomyces sp. NPDC055966]|uniref:winged helix-turn-helix domain-containing protein n=1 Tax=Streptomyces sp. NPDC055966 TaxID=3345669 RepID=UPI0035DC2676